MSCSDIFFAVLFSRATVLFSLSLMSFLSFSSCLVCAVRLSMLLVFDVTKLPMTPFNVFINLVFDSSDPSCGGAVFFVSCFVNLSLYIDLLSRIVPGSTGYWKWSFSTRPHFVFIAILHRTNLWLLPVVKESSTSTS